MGSDQGLQPSLSVKAQAGGGEGRSPPRGHEGKAPACSKPLGWGGDHRGDRRGQTQARQMHLHYRWQGESSQRQGRGPETTSSGPEGGLLGTLGRRVKEHGKFKWMGEKGATYLDNAYEEIRFKKGGKNGNHKTKWQQTL